MLSVSHTTCASTGDILDKALSAAEFYGFEAIDTVLKERKPTRPIAPAANINFALPHERKLYALTKNFIAHGLRETDKPVFTYQIESATARGSNKQSSTLGLHALGCPDAIAEGVLIAALVTLLRDAGLSEFVVHINSVGDRESSSRFLRELTSYLRGKLNDMPAYAGDEMRAGNPIRAFMKLAEKDHDIALGAPNPMEYLNDESRLHLRKVLEYTENVEAPYELNPTILGSSDCWQHTLFEIRVPENGCDVIVARGGRYNTLAQKGFRTNLPLAGVFLDHEVRGRIKPKRRNKKKLKFFFAQLGPAAKLQSFSVLENLRSAGIPVAQAVAIESIGKQLEQAQARDVPYTIIIGHKEALEDTAIVRNMLTRSQVVVPLPQLTGYLKRLRV